ncbi:hypothetical protein BXP70_16335 [Hymenobacter crusticola]|uniref:Alpha-2-macroglobulin domain-containing protein n=1 Tax=Hymenobacter crusticola TaxID=1770526 RepID=A0A243WCU5_9BACT|nr:hypothetical protein BXP70_16335 [Hymenobacter crusticola]
MAQARRQSYYTKVFQLTDAQIKQLYSKGLGRIEKTFFTQPVDSFPTDSLTGNRRPLPNGYYLVAHAEGSRLVYWLRTVTDRQLHVLDNQVDLALTVQNVEGQLVPDAEVRLRNRLIPFDALTRTYRLAKGGHQGILSVTAAGRTTYHVLNRTFPRKAIVSSWSRRLLYGFPLGYLKRPLRTFWQELAHASYTSSGLVGLLRSAFNEEVRDERQQRRDDKRERTWTGYLVLSKPRYRPTGDTLRLKARVLRRRNGRPSSAPLTLWLSSNGQAKKIVTLHAVRPGSYIYDLPLTDTLGFQADRTVQVRLEDEQGLTRASTSFLLEDYELKSTHYSLRVAEAEQRRGMPQALFLRGTDANELPLLDARVRVAVVPEGLKELAAPVVFVPDTLWTATQPLDPVGETRLNLPPQVLPAAELRYRVIATFLNADNERRVEQQTVEYHLDPAELQLTLRHDSLQLRYSERGQSVPHAATLELWAAGSATQPLTQQAVQLPLLLPVQPQVVRYVLRDLEGRRAELRLSSSNAELALRSDRTRDSLQLEVDNPRRLPFWYFLYRGNTLVQRGYGKSWHLTTRTASPEPWFVSLHYFWGGQMQAAEYKVPLPQKALHIRAEQPTVAYPGQHLRLRYTVTDASGEPMPGVDLTAYAYTTKFEQAEAPNLPSFEPSVLGRSTRRRFSLGATFDNNPAHAATRPLAADWPHWRTQLGLDSLLFYQFLYPATGQFREYRPAPGGITQLAPFVVDSGRVAPAAAVYIDGVPAYIREINHTEPYAIVADSGYHTVAIRTATRLVTLQRVYLRHLQKLTLSVDPARVQPEVQVVQQRAVFTPAEQANLGRYVLPVSVGVSAWPGGATLRQGNRLQVINQGSYQYAGGTRLAGPFRPDSVLYREAAGGRRKFLFEPYYRYHFAPGLVKMTSTAPHHFAPLSTLAGLNDSVPLKGFALTEAAVRAQVGRLVPVQRLVLDDTIQTRAGQGTLQLWVPPTEHAAEAVPAPLFTLLTQPSKPSFTRLLRGLMPVRGLAPGRYQAVVLLADSTCLVPAQVQVQANGTTYLQLRRTDQRQGDSERQRIRRVVQQRQQLAAAQPALPTVRPLAPRPKTSTLVRNPDWLIVQGRVVDQGSEEGLPGVTVLVKGITIGVSTNADGSFELAVPPHSLLTFASVGYVTQEQLVGSGGAVEVRLHPDTKALDEVVVVGYGMQRVGQLLSGKVAGVSVASSASIQIRGNASTVVSMRPLLIVDGVPFEGQQSDLDPSAIRSLKVLKDEQAVALYGARAAAGVIIIQTNGSAARRAPSLADAATPAGATGQDTHFALRRRFSDYAWWRPVLFTDSHGQATTEVTLPDDVTGWNTFVLGSDDHGRTGSATGRLRSFKTLLAELAVPRFLVQGDRVQVLGKALNYLPDSTVVTTSFSLNKNAPSTRQHQLTTAVIDTLTLTAPTAADSLQLTYKLQQANGYHDGEVRTIPVLPQGSRERVGTFVVLTAADTTLQLPINPTLGEVTLRVESDPLPLLLDEIRQVQAYPYLCNEQAASKLKALLVEQRIRKVLQQSFTAGHQIQQLIRTLLRGQHQPEGLWGTWPASPVSPWVTLHVLEALLAAEQQDFAVKLDRKVMQQYLLGLLDALFADDASREDPRRSRLAADRIRLLQLLHQLGTEIDYATYLKRLDQLGRSRQLLDVYLAATTLRQQLHLPYQVDTLRRFRRATELGGIFYEDTLHATNSYYQQLLPTRIGNTLLAYKVLRAKGGYETELLRLRTFLLNQRVGGHWSSTYEAACILETISPELLLGKQSIKEVASTVKLSGPLTQEIARFPFQTTLPATSSSLSLRKQGPLPVYATAYQTFLNPKPAAVQTPFRVTTALAGQTGARVSLRTGQPVELVVTVDVPAEARYVLVEVPIPAGCSYGSAAPTNRYEVHREYLRQQTGIFCDVLPAGRHVFRVALQPRFRGHYTLNPAKAELMYFPTRFGRAASKQVVME